MHSSGSESPPHRLLLVIIVLRSSAGRYDILRQVHDVEKYKTRLGPSISHLILLQLLCRYFIFLVKRLRCCENLHEMQIFTISRGQGSLIFICSGYYLHENSHKIVVTHFFKIWSLHNITSLGSQQKFF